MRKLLMAVLICLGIMSTLYADDMFVKHAGEYDILVSTKLTYEGFFLDDYDITAKIVKDGNTVNLCIGYMDCSMNKRFYSDTCPRTDDDWTNALRDIDFICTEAQPSLRNILPDKN